jgi:hypothetical protein
MEQVIKDRFSDAILQEARRRYDIDPNQIRALDAFESFIYEFEREGNAYILRLAHSLRRTETLIQGEVDWINYLAAGGVSAAKAILSQEGNLVEAIDDSYGGAFLVTAFVKAQGEPPWDLWTPELYETYGRLIGRMHTGHEAEAAETFRQQTQVAAPDYAFDPDSFWSINGVNELTRQQQAILKALHIYRDQEASFRNKPLFKIFHDKTLVQLAAEEPRHLSQLRHVYGMSEGQIRRYGRILLQIIEKAQNDPQPSYPKRGKRPSDQVIARYDTLHNWRKLRARKRGVESDVIVSRNALWALAHANPYSLQDLTKIEELGGWHRETYGQEILKLLHK